MIIFMNLCKKKGILGSWKLWFSYTNEILRRNKNFGSFLARFQPIFNFELKGKRSRAEPMKILQLELWLEPARLGLITTIQYPQFDAKKGYPKDENFFFLFKRKADKRLLIKSEVLFTSWELTLAIQYSH